MSEDKQTDEDEKSTAVAGQNEHLVMPLHEEIISLLRKRAEMEYEYINPNFLSLITAAVSDYYQLDDDAVYSWIQDMYEA